MKKFLTFLFFALLFFCAIRMFAQIPDLSWVKQIGSSSSTFYRKQTTDYLSGATIHSISFNSTTDVDPGPGVITFTGSGGGDIGLIKIDANGNTLWAKQIAGPGYERASNLAMDNSGNVYVTGFFNNTVDFDPGAGTYGLTSSGSYNGFILKLDVNGNFIWVQQIRNSNSIEIRDIKISISGIIVVTGFFNGTVDLDPGVATYGITTPANNNDVFVATYDSNSGAFIWGDIFIGTGSDIANALTIDPVSNQIIFTGIFTGTCDWDPNGGVSNLTSPGYSTAIVSLNLITGALVWAKMFTGTGSASGLDIVADDNGNIWVSGTVVGSVDFDPNAGTFLMNGPGPGITNSYFVQLNSSGNFIRGLQMVGASENFCNAVTIDHTNNWAYFVGGFKGTADFDPGAGTNNVNSIGNQGWYVIALDENGIFQWGGGSGGDFFSQAYDVAVDVNRKIYISGHFYTTVDFDPDLSSSTNLTATGSPDVFFLSLNYPDPLPVSFLYFNGKVKNKIVELNWATDSEINNSYFTIDRSPDGNNFSRCGIVFGSGNTTQFSEYTFADPTAPKGLVYYLLNQTDIDGTKKDLGMIALENTSDDNFYINAFPLDAGLKILSSEHGTFLLQIFSINGNLIYKKEVVFDENQNVEINGKIFTSGMYILNVRNERKTFSGKFFFQ